MTGREGDERVVDAEVSEMAVEDHGSNPSKLVSSSLVIRLHPRLGLSTTQLVFCKH